MKWLIFIENSVEASVESAVVSTPRRAYKNTDNAIIQISSYAYFALHQICKSTE